MHILVRDNVFVCSFEHRGAIVKSCEDGMRSTFIGELLGFVVCSISQEFLHLNIVDAVILWVVEVFHIDGQSQIWTLTINSGWLNIEALVVDYIVWLEISRVFITLFDLKLVSSTQIFIIVISLVKTLIY